MSEDGPDLEIRPMPRERLVELLTLRWPDQNMFLCGRFVGPEDVEGIGAFAGERLHGVATWMIMGRVMHVIAVNAFTELRGVGARLVEAMIVEAREQGLALLRATVSNDNVVGLRFYQKRGFRVTGLNRGIFDVMRHVKPSIPRTGLDGIPMRDEFELELEL
ncbi:MAG TPA: GNAT family N-acetyltransferase [Xanthobacteraceae bacterium]|nr:GNAT family N-acetyltransferase [Xanthobacteraceae bacterium]